MPMIQVEALNHENRVRFRRLASPGLLPLLESAQTVPGLIALGAAAGDRIVGIFVAVPAFEPAHAYAIGQFRVLQEFFSRHTGAKDLWVEGERAMRAQGALSATMELDLPVGSRESLLFLDLLEELEWQEVRLCYTAFSIRDTNITRESWFRLEVPKGYELFPWKDLVPGEREMVEAWGATHEWEMGDYLDPFDVAPFDPHTSLGLRQRATGKVVGWIINEAQSPNLLCFRRLFIMPGERCQGLFHPLLSNAINLYLSSRYTLVRFRVMAENARMKTAIVRMMGHRCEGILEHYFCRKIFASEHVPSGRQE
jgi:hypothetical protein